MNIKKGAYGLVVMVGYYDDDGDKPGDAIVYLGPMLESQPIIVPRKYLNGLPGAAVASAIASCIGEPHKT